MRTNKERSLKRIYGFMTRKDIFFWNLCIFCYLEYKYKYIILIRARRSAIPINIKKFLPSFLIFITL